MRYSKICWAALDMPMLMIKGANLNEHSISGIPTQPYEPFRSMPGSLRGKATLSIKVGGMRVCRIGIPFHVPEVCQIPAFFDLKY